MSKTVGDLFCVMDTIAPFSSCMEWDHVGLLVGDKAAPLNGVLVTLDVTPEAVAEAVRIGADCIVSHHPVIFQPLARLPFGSVPALCIRAGISVISAHTNYDFAPQGINYALAQALGLSGIRPFGPENAARPYLSLVVFVPQTHAEQVYDAMCVAGAGRQGNYSGCAFFANGEGRFLPEVGANPFLGTVGTPEKAAEMRLEMLCSPEVLPAVLDAMRAAHPYEEPAYSVLYNHALNQQTVYGMIGTLPTAITAHELAILAEDALSTHACYSENGRPIRTVAVCGGAGADFMDDALAAGADAFLTGEVKHHEWFAAKQSGLCLMAAGHHATEHIAMPQLANQIRDALPEIAVTLFDSSPTCWA